MLEQKQGQFWNLHRIPNQNIESRFLFFFLDKKKVIVILFENLPS